MNNIHSITLKLCLVCFKLAISNFELHKNLENLELSIKLYINEFRVNLTFVHVQCVFR